MGSVLISDVGHHFPHHTLLGANAHQHPPPDATADQNYSFATSSRSSQSDASAHKSPRRMSLVDFPMPDASPRPAISIEPGHQSQTVSNSAREVGEGTAKSEESKPTPRKPRPESPPTSALTPSQRSQHGAERHGHNSSVSSSNQTSPVRSVRSYGASAGASPSRIKVLSLSHIQSFTTDQLSSLSLAQSDANPKKRDAGEAGPQYEISEMPVSDIIEMVAGLLTKITTTNDEQHEHLHRNIPSSEGSGGLSAQTASVLAFHGKNIPSITILSYLSRIHKYCPTTYEVFLSLLVYFDRMTELVNSGPIQSMRRANSRMQLMGAKGHSRQSSQTSWRPDQSSPTPTPSSYGHGRPATPPPSGSIDSRNDALTKSEQSPSPPVPMDPPLENDTPNLSHFFVVDSFNIHRLVIAGVTCASKFFSDVFYTNSRYAKVSETCYSIRGH
jgi:PHO85 cyclin-6/7